MSTTKFISDLALAKSNSIYSAIDVATTAARKSYNNALGLRQMDLALQNSFARNSTLSAVMGLSSYASSLHQGLGHKSALSAIMGLSNVSQALVHKSTFASYAGLIYSERKHQTMLTATLGLSSICRAYPSKYLVDNIAQSERLRTVIDTQLSFSKQYLGMAKLNSSWSTYHQLNSLHKFYNSFTAGVAVKAAAIEAEEDLELIEEITEQVAELTSGISERGYITRNDIGLIQKISKYIGSIEKADWQWLINLIIPSLLSLWAIEIGYKALNQSNNNSPSPLHQENLDKATQQDLLGLRDTLTLCYNSTKRPLGFEKELICDVQLKVEPNKNAYTIKTVEKGTVVTVWDVNGNWVYVSYADLQTNLPSTGWISSSYFRKGLFSSKTKEKRKSTANKGI